MMKILCLEPSLDRCAKVLHKRHLLQCYLEVLDTLAFLGGIHSAYPKHNTNTRMWEGHSGALYSYLESLKSQLDSYGEHVSDLRYLRRASDVDKHYCSVLRTSGLPKWFGGSDTLDMHRGWVMKTSKNHRGLHEHYAPMYGEIKPVSRIKKHIGVSFA